MLDDDDRCREQDRAAFGYASYISNRDRNVVTVKRNSKASISPEHSQEKKSVPHRPPLTGSKGTPQNKANKYIDV